MENRNARGNTTRYKYCTTMDDYEFLQKIRYTFILCPLT